MTIDTFRAEVERDVPPSFDGISQGARELIVPEGAGRIITPAELRKEEFKKFKARFDERDAIEMAEAIEFAKQTQLLDGRNVLAVGACNKESITAAIGQLANAAGANVAYTYFGDNDLKNAREIFETTGVLHEQLDITDEEQLKIVIPKIAAFFNGEIHDVVHGVAGGVRAKGELQPHITNMDTETLLRILNTSALSFNSLVKACLPYMVPRHSSAMTISYHGSTHIAEGYAVMGVAKAALEAVARALQADPAVKENGTRIITLSPTTIPTRAASGIEGFDLLAKQSAERMADGELPTRAAVAKAAVILMSEFASAIQGTVFPDGGDHLYH